MSDNEKELINIIRESEDPGIVATYMFSLFLDYLQKHAPAPETLSASQQESA
jgi:hypothetical protein